MTSWLSGLFRQDCLVCGQVLGFDSIDNLFCLGCEALVPGLHQQRCPFCARRLIDPRQDCPVCKVPALPRRFSLAIASYEAAAVKLVVMLKRGDRRSAALWMSRWLAARLREHLASHAFRTAIGSNKFAHTVIQNQPDIEFPGYPISILPVPSSRQSFIERGFNPAQTLAALTARQLGLRGALELGLLFKDHETSPQHNSRRAERLRNPLNAYRLHPTALPRLRHRWLVVIDDVMTTGATLDSVCDTLEAVKPLGITRLVFARTEDY